MLELLISGVKTLFQCGSFVLFCFFCFIFQFFTEGDRRGGGHFKLRIVFLFSVWPFSFTVDLRSAREDTVTEMQCLFLNFILSFAVVPGNANCCSVWSFP